MPHTVMPPLPSSTRNVADVSPAFGTRRLDCLLHTLFAIRLRARARRTCWPRFRNPSVDICRYPRVPTLQGDAVYRHLLHPPDSRQIAPLPLTILSPGPVPRQFSQQDVLGISQQKMRRRTASSPCEKRSSERCRTCISLSVPPPDAGHRSSKTGSSAGTCRPSVRPPPARSVLRPAADAASPRPDAAR